MRDSPDGYSHTSDIDCRIDQSPPCSLLNYYRLGSKNIGKQKETADQSKLPYFQLLGLLTLIQTAQHMRVVKIKRKVRKNMKKENNTHNVIT